MNNQIGESLLLQWIMAKGVVGEEKALECARQIWQDERLEGGWLRERLEGLRERLVPFDLELRHLFSFELDQYIWALSNKNGDRIAELATTYTPEQLEYFKRLLQLISTSPHLQASTVDALLQLTSTNIDAPSTFNKQQCEQFIDDLVSKQWIIKKSSSGKLLLGPRSAIELEGYLREEELFEDCCICHALVTSQHVICGNDQCASRAHQHCHMRVKGADPTYSCPNCQSEEWQEG